MTVLFRKFVWREEARPTHNLFISCVLLLMRCPISSLFWSPIIVLLYCVHVALAVSWILIFLMRAFPLICYHDFLFRREWIMGLTYSTQRICSHKDKYVFGSTSIEPKLWYRQFNVEAILHSFRFLPFVYIRIVSSNILFQPFFHSNLI